MKLPHIFMPQTKILLEKGFSPQNPKYKKEFPIPKGSLRDTPGNCKFQFAKLIKQNDFKKWLKPNYVMRIYEKSYITPVFAIVE